MNHSLSASANVLNVDVECGVCGVWGSGALGLLNFYDKIRI